MGPLFLVLSGKSLLLGTFTPVFPKERDKRILHENSGVGGMQNVAVDSAYI